MKTKNLLPALLVLIIRVTMSGQTKEIQSQYHILNTLGAKHANSSLTQQQSSKEKAELTNKNNARATTVKVYPTLISSESATHTAIDNNTFNYYSNPACYSGKIYADQLLKQSGELLEIAASLRIQAKENTGLSASARLLEEQAELKQVQASEINGKLSLEEFNKNEITFKALLAKVKKEVVYETAKEVNSEAVSLMNSAKNMREEAYAVTSPGARHGIMSNAEEKEGLALTKQEEAISMLKNAIAADKLFPANDLAVK